MYSLAVVMANGNTSMGAKPIDDAGKAQPLMLILCVNSLNYHWNTHRRFDDNTNADVDANALCERTFWVIK